MQLKKVLIFLVVLETNLHIKSLNYSKFVCFLEEAIVNLLQIATSWSLEVTCIAIGVSL